MKRSKKAAILIAAIAILATTAVTAFAFNADQPISTSDICPNPTCQYVNDEGICEGPKDGSCRTDSSMRGQGLRDGSGSGAGNGGCRRNQNASCRLGA